MTRADFLTHQRSTGTCRKQPTKNAPAEAEKTEKSSGALTPNAKAIVSANNNSIKPLNNAATGVKNPKTSAKPNKTSANVAAHANAGITADRLRSDTKPSPPFVTRRHFST